MSVIIYILVKIWEAVTALLKYLELLNSSLSVKIDNKKNVCKIKEFPIIASKTKNYQFQEPND